MFQYILKMVGLHQEDVRSFTVRWSELILTMFIHSDRVGLLYCYV